MDDWKEVRLGDVIRIKSGLPYKGEYLNKGDNYLLGMGCVSFTETFLTNGARHYSDDGKPQYIGKPGDIVLATRQQSDKMPILGMPALIPDILNGAKIIVGSNLYMVENTSDIDNKFIFWLLRTPNYINHIKNSQTGTTVRMITKKDIENFTFLCPPKHEQGFISSLLWNIQNKIETNRKINARLEELAQAIFKSWFIDFTPFGGQMPEDWEIKSLSQIANYLNGLAMQKYPPLNKEDRLPVLKIKELREGKFSENSDSCSKTDIGNLYIIENGDVIFSWSGTLLVKIWTGGRCGLNQHLFKVTSNNYPKWFYYFWTLHHNENFKRIAKDKAVTMGHIKREELDKAMVNIPSLEIFEQIDSIMTPILQHIISRCLESARLVELRDALLPKLMSGEIKVEGPQSSQSTQSTQNNSTI